MASKSEPGIGRTQHLSDDAVFQDRFEAISEFRRPPRHTSAASLTNISNSPSYVLTQNKMPADPTVFLLKSYLYLPGQDAAAMLGRIVKNYHSPNDNFAPQHPELYNMFDVIPADYGTFSLGALQKRKSWAAILAENIGSIRWVGEGDKRTSLEGKRIWSRRLQQHDLFFEAVKEDDEVMARVPGWIGPLNSHICMIVGVYLCENVEMSESNGQASAASVDVHIPAGTAVSPKPTTIGNISLQAGRLTDEQSHFKATGNGQYIFGLELKLVKRKKWRNPKELELTDNAPKIIPGRKLGPEDAKVEHAQENVEGDGIGAKLVDIDDDLAQELYEACSADDES